MKRFSVFLSAFISILLFATQADAQLMAYSTRSQDNNCQLIYLVNPSDSILYIKGLSQEKINNCQTFTTISTKKVEYEINLSEKENNYLLLLPKDTIVYRALIPAESLMQPKKLLLQSRYSEKVLKTNNQKKRNKKISKLPAVWLTIPVIEK
jgi:hypothetical protein